MKRKKSNKNNILYLYFHYGFTLPYSFVLCDFNNYNNINNY